MQHTKRYQCRHIFTDGHRCGSPCLRGEDFCYYHHTTRRPATENRRGRQTHFDLALPEDRSAIPSAIGEVLRRIARNEIDPRRAGLLLYGLQIASLNLKQTREPKRDDIPVEEIVEHPQLGHLAPQAEVGTTRQSRPSFIQELMDTLNSPPYDEVPEPQPQPDPTVLPTIQATATHEDPKPDRQTTCRNLSRRRQRSRTRKVHAILSPDMYKRVLLKLSGEALAAGRGFGIDAIFIHKVAEEIAAVHALGCQIGIVVGGGNFFRGVAQQAIDMDRVAADHMGMLSTVINSIALQDAIEKRGLFCRVMSAIEMHQVAEPYIRRRAMRHLEKGRIVIFAAGTGNPYFSTDTAASLRAMEIRADILLKATSVDGIYTADPKKDPDAVKFEQITYSDIIRLGLGVMDTTAVSLCRDNNMPMMVFSMREQGNIVRVVSGEKLGSLVTA